MQETVTGPAATDAKPRETDEAVPGRVAVWRRSAAAAWMRISARKRMGLVVFTLCLAVYLSIMVLVPRYKGMPTTQGDEPHYLLVTESILRDGDVFLANNYEAGDYEDFFEDDISLWHVAHGKGGRYVSTHPMAMSVLVLPAFWMFGYRGAAVTMALLMSLAAMFSFLVTDRFVKRTIAAGVTLFLFFTYPLVFYSRLIYPETVAVFLVALGLWSAWRMKESANPAYAGVLGLCAGGVILFHPKFIAITIAFFALLFIARPARDWRYVAWWLVPAAACVLALIGFTSIAFGPKILTGLTASGGSRFQGGYWGTNSVWGIPGLYIDRAWGLLMFAPFYGLFAAGLACQKTELEWERWWVFFPLVIALHTLVLGVFQSWNGGAAPVQRYLVPLAPVFLLCVAVLLDRVRSAWVWAAAAVLGIYQVVMTVWGFRFMPGTFGMESTDNILLQNFLGNNIVKRFLLFVFPNLHPGDVRAVWLTIGWVLFFVATTWLARRHYMRFGGGKLPPAY